MSLARPSSRSCDSCTTSSMRASGRSVLLTSRMTGSFASSALRSTKRVCGSGPSEASTSSTTPSTMERPRSTSPPKSAWPGVSITLIVTGPSVACSPRYVIAVFLARIVMPFSRSSSLLSIARSSTCAWSPNECVCLSIASTSVVLPWSTCATIATLRRSERVACAMMGALRSGVRPGPEARRRREDRGALARVGAVMAHSETTTWYRPAVPGRTGSVRHASEVRLRPYRADDAAAVRRRGAGARLVRVLRLAAATNALDAGSSRPTGCSATDHGNLVVEVEGVGMVGDVGWVPGAPRPAAERPRAERGHRAVRASTAGRATARRRSGSSPAYLFAYTRSSGSRRRRT